ncbi:MAG TPA: amidohydrolase family protein [Planctomycetaceae bacterium]|nr:amidohydrolase family protein [Planctomycetaceae bacterium]
MKPQQRAAGLNGRMVRVISKPLAYIEEAGETGLLDFSMDTFGEDRVMFAGDWPVCTLRATFAQWLGALKEIVAKRSAEFQRKLFHDNAAKFYGV